MSEAGVADGGPRERLEACPECDSCGALIAPQSLIEDVAPHVDLSEYDYEAYSDESSVRTGVEGVDNLCSGCIIEERRTEMFPELRPTDVDADSEEATFDVDMEMVAISYLVSNPGSTTSDVAKAVFDPEETEELRNADRKVRYYFEEKHPGLVECDGSESPKRYRANPDRVFFGASRLQMHTVGGEEVSLGLGAVLLYLDDNGRPVISVLGQFTSEGEESVFEYPVR